MNDDDGGGRRCWHHHHRSASVSYRIKIFRSTRIAHTFLIKIWRQKPTNVSQPQTAIMLCHSQRYRTFQYLVIKNSNTTNTSIDPFHFHSKVIRKATLPPITRRTKLHNCRGQCFIDRLLDRIFHRRGIIRVARMLVLSVLLKFARILFNTTS